VLGSRPRLRPCGWGGPGPLGPGVRGPGRIASRGRPGGERTRRRNAGLADRVRARLSAVAGLRPATPRHPALRGFLTAFPLPPRTDPAALRKGLWEDYRIEAPVVERPESPPIRGSTHLYNTPQANDRLAEALPVLLA